MAGHRKDRKSPESGFQTYMEAEEIIHTDAAVVRCLFLVCGLQKLGLTNG